MTQPVRRATTARLRRLAAVAIWLAVPAAMAQFTMVPAPQCSAPRDSASDAEQAYRVDAARHLYACYPTRVYHGMLPPLMYSIMMVETALDANGGVVDVRVVRKPAADEVAPWVLAMIRRAAPYPAPSRFPGRTVTFTETFFVDKSGLFQTHSLTEGQR